MLYSALHVTNDYFCMSHACYTCMSCKFLLITLKIIDSMLKGYFFVIHYQIFFLFFFFLVHHKSKKNVSYWTHLYVFPNLYDFLSSGDQTFW